MNPSPPGRASHTAFWHCWPQSVATRCWQCHASGWFDVPDIHVHPSCSLLLLPLDKAGPVPACISDAINLLRTAPWWCTWKEAQPVFTAASLLLKGERPNHQYQDWKEEIALSPTVCISGGGSERGRSLFWLLLCGRGLQLQSPC